MEEAEKLDEIISILQQIHIAIIELSTNVTKLRIGLTEIRKDLLDIKTKP